jgi:hypothetical protein
LRYPDSRDEGDPVGDPPVELVKVDIDVTGSMVPFYGADPFTWDTDDESSSAS